MSESAEQQVRRIIREELNTFSRVPGQTERPVKTEPDEAEALETVIKHVQTCKDPFCTVSSHIDKMVDENYKGCQECGTVNKKGTLKCKNCGEELEESSEEEE